jgi:hypothetical protein
MKPQNFEERLIWYTLISTYLLYITGLLFPVNTTICWVLLVRLLRKIWLQKNYPSSEQLHIPWTIWVLIISMMVMLFSTIVGLVDFNYDAKEIIRSMLNWTRDWSLLALFPLIGCCLNIRPKLIYRAACIICLQSLIIMPICCLAYVLKFPPLLYSSPLERITQNGKIYYNIILYIRDYDSGGLRLSLFTPWAPALGLISCIFLIFALNESNAKWRLIGLLGSIAMLILSVSRGALVFLPLVILAVWMLTTLSNYYLQIAAGFTCFVGGLFSAQFLDALKAFFDEFSGARKSSSEVRAALERLALERWLEAPIWGHGKPIKGPPLLKGMPIGSHHTWFGLLFTQGAIGFSAFLIPSVTTVIALIIKLQKDQTARVGLSVWLLILFASMSDNIEKLAYIYWSALLVVGIALRADS